MYYCSPRICWYRKINKCNETGWWDIAPIRGILLWLEFLPISNLFYVQKVCYRGGKSISHPLWVQSSYKYKAKTSDTRVPDDVTIREAELWTLLFFCQSAGLLWAAFSCRGNSWPISLCAVVPSCRCHDPRCNNNILVICLWQELIRVRSCWQPRTCSVWEPCWVWHTVTVASSALLGILFSLHFRYSWLIH